MPQIPAYQPEYYKDFICAGGECRYTCCRGRDITLDNEDRDRYASAEYEPLRQKLSGNILADGPAPLKPRFKLDENGNCPFLDGGGLCEIQKDGRGRSVIPRVCRSYPGIINNVCGEIEAFLSMTCEAAAKLALFNADIMKFVEMPAEYDNHVDYVLEPESYVPCENGAEIFWNLRIAVIFALQNRKYPVWLRIAILGIFIKQADEFINGGRENELAALGEELMSNIENGAFDGYADQIPLMPELEAHIAFHILEELDKDGTRGLNGPLGVCVSQAREGFGIAKGVKPEKETADAFADNRRRFYGPFFAGRGYIYENYLANTVFMTGFPFTYEREGSVYANYIRLASAYLTLRTMLAGMACYYKRGFGQDEIIRVVSSLSRAFEENPALTDSLANKLEALGMTEMGRLCLLLKE